MSETLRKTTRGKNRRVYVVNPLHDKLGDSSVTYQLEYVKCGKPKCDKWHGPYWYAYWSEAGRTRTLYVGKVLRSAADIANERNRKRRAPRRRRMRQQELPHTGAAQ
jgi:hypothetical protein